jgi:hypothetical protein
VVPHTNISCSQNRIIRNKSEQNEKAKNFKQSTSPPPEKRIDEIQKSPGNRKSGRTILALVPQKMREKLLLVRNTSKEILKNNLNKENILLFMSFNFISAAEAASLVKHGYNIG